MCDIAWPRLSEDVVRYGMANQTTQVDRIDVALLGQINIADVSMNWDSFSGFKMVYCAEREVIDRLWGHRSAYV